MIFSSFYFLKNLIKLLLNFYDCDIMSSKFRMLKWRNKIARTDIIYIDCICVVYANLF